MQKNTPKNWPSIVAACAEAIPKTGQTPRQWFKENFPNVSWETGRKYLTRASVNAVSGNSSPKQKRVPRGGGGGGRSSPKRLPRKSEGGQPGNKNAMTHGIYSREMSAEDQLRWEMVNDLDNVNRELTVARVQLSRALSKQAEYAAAQTPIDSADELKSASLAHIPITGHEVDMGTEGGNEKWVRSLPDIDAVIDRTIRSISQLMKQKKELEQSPILTRADQQTHIQMVMGRVARGDITALEGGFQLEALMITPPQTLSAMIKVELLQDTEETYEGGGVSAEEINRKAIELEAKIEKDRRKFLPERIKQLEQLDKDMGL